MPIRPPAERLSGAPQHHQLAERHPNRYPARFGAFVLNTITWAAVDRLLHHGPFALTSADGIRVTRAPSTGKAVARVAREAPDGQVPWLPPGSPAPRARGEQASVTRLNLLALDRCRHWSACGCEVEIGRGHGAA